LRKIYHLNPDTKDTLIHPMLLGRRAVESEAVYNYPNASNQSESK